MSMPEIDLDAIDREEALASVLASIALQEAAMAHIMNADGEKMQRAINLTDPAVMQGSYTGSPSMDPAVLNSADADVVDVLDINKNVGEMLDKAGEFEISLRDKMNDVLSFFNADDAVLENTCSIDISATPAAAGTIVTFTGRRQIPLTTPIQYQIISRTVALDSTGKAKIELPSGDGTEDIDYTIRQIKAPAGYLADPVTQFFSVGGTASCPSATFAFASVTAPTPPAIP